MDGKTRLSTYRHDLRNHLSVIHLYTELLEQHLTTLGNDDKKTRSYIVTILNRCVRMEIELKKLVPGKFTSLLEDEAYTQSLEPKR